MIAAWYLTSLLVFNVICAFIWADHGPHYRLKERDYLALLVLSVLWPIGMAFIVMIALDHRRARQATNEST